jgi:hypothetical protein
MSSQHHAPAALPRNRHRYSLDRKLSRFQDGHCWEKKKFPFPWIEPGPSSSVIRTALSRLLWGHPLFWTGVVCTGISFLEGSRMPQIPKALDTYIWYKKSLYKKHPVNMKNLGPYWDTWMWMQRVDLLGTNLVFNNERNNILAQWSKEVILCLKISLMLRDHQRVNLIATSSLNSYWIIFSTQITNSWIHWTLLP